jgi:hypothetical protein
LRGELDPNTLELAAESPDAVNDVRARGTWGEISLESLLQQMLSPEQYEKNVEVNPSSGNRVDVAIKLPGNESDSPVWMPIDSKFPIEAYRRLVTASEHGDVHGVNQAGAELESDIKRCAKDISDKYISPPHSTNFGILFLPSEGLFAEVIRRPGLMDSLQATYRVTVAGPTTLGTVLTSRRMGLRLLAGIQKESSEALSSDRLHQFAKQLEQNPIGARFEQRGEYFAIAQSGYQNDREAAADLTTRQLLPQVRLKTRELASRTLRLSNAPGWQTLPTTSQRFQELVDQDIELLTEQIGIAWAALVSLGSFIEQDDEIRRNGDHFIEPLGLDVRRSLIDLVQTTGPWLRRFPSAQKLDEDHARFQTPLDRVPPARQVLTAIKKGEVVRPDEVAILDDTLNAGEHVGYQSGKIRNYGIISVRNLAFGVMTFLASSLAEGFLKDIGEEVAKHSALAEKSKIFLLKSEDELGRFLSDLPADIRAAVRTLIQELKKLRSST